MTRDPLIGFWRIGYTSNDPAMAYCGSIVPQYLWSRFISERLQPDLDWGVRRFLLHLPFGAWPNAANSGGMVFEQALNAATTAKTWLLSGFVDAIKPLTEKGVEAILYIGSPDTLSADIPEPLWRELKTACLWPALSAGCSVAFDNACAAPFHGRTHRLLESLSQSGTRTYIEAWPSAPHLWGWDFVCREDQFQMIRDRQRSTDPAARAQVADYAPLARLGGEMVRLADRDDWQPQIASLTRQILADGNTACVPVSSLKSAGIKRSDLIVDR